MGRESIHFEIKVIDTLGPIVLLYLQCWRRNQMKNELYRLRNLNKWQIRFQKQIWNNEPKTTKLDETEQRNIQARIMHTRKIKIIRKKIQCGRA